MLAQGRAAGHPRGWGATTVSLHNWPNELSNVVIRMQKFCGHPCQRRPYDRNQRGRSTFRSRKDVPRDVSGKGNTSNSRAIHAPSLLRTILGSPATGLCRWGGPVSPFLRAHEPNLPGPGIPREPWPAKFLVKNFLLPPKLAIRNGQELNPLCVSLRTGACGHSSPRPAPGR